MASSSSCSNESDSSRSNSSNESDKRELLHASFKGEVQDVVRILKKNYMLILQSDSDGNTALHLAAKEGHGNTVSKMIDLAMELKDHMWLGDVLTAQNDEEDTPLYLALLAGYDEIAIDLVNVDRRLAVEEGDCIDFDGAPFEGPQVDDIIQILEKNPRLVLNGDSDGNTTFHIAAKKGLGDILSKMIHLFMEMKDLKLLTRALNQRNVEGDKPLYLALLAGYNEIALKLVNADREAASFVTMNECVLVPRRVGRAAVDVDMFFYREFKGSDEYEDTLTVLQKAAEAGEKDRAEKILKKNPSLIQSPDEQGRTFVHTAASNGNVETLKQLKPKVLRRILLTETNQGDTALHLSLLGGHEMAAYYLIKVQPRAAYQPNNKGDSPLSMAIDWPYPDLVRHITRIADNNIRMSLLQHAQDQKLAHAAVKTRNLAVLQALMDGLPELIESKDGEGRTPLSFAAAKGYYQQVRYFCEKFVDSVSKCDGTGSSPIHQAIHQAIAGGHLTIVKEILPRCPKPIHGHVDESNRSIEHYANKSNNKDMLSYLNESKII